MTTILPRTLWYHTRELEQVQVHESQLSKFSECLVILGEPGMGKTSLLRALSSIDGAALCTARQLINRHDPRTLLGNRQELVIDALDEVAAAGQGDAVDAVLRRLGELDYPRFVLSCRVADWRAATSVNAIEEQYGALPLELHLDPLDRDQQRALLAAKVGEARADELLEHFEAFDLDVLGNPQTLELIAALPVGQALPQTRGRLFAVATDQLRREHKDGKPELRGDAALDAAGAAFAALLLTGSTHIFRRASANAADGALPFAEVEALAGAVLDQVIGTRLFSGSADRFTYWHRRIGEYLAARWLATRADTRGKRRRLLAMLRSEGRVPANLRGLHAWLALDAELASDVIATDPMGVIEYGDADCLTVKQASQMLDALEHLSRNNPRFVGWGEYRASSLAASPLHDEVRAAIADRSREFGLRKLLLDQLRGDAVTPAMRDVLLRLQGDPDEQYVIRERAGQVLIGAGGVDWPAELEAIRCQADRYSTRLAFELMDNVGVATFGDPQIVATVLAYDGLSLCPVPQADENTMVARYWKFVRSLPSDRHEGLLDLFAQYIEALLPKYAGIDEHDFLDMFYELVLARLASGPVDPRRLWFWLHHIEDQNSYQRGRRDQLSKWFEAHAGDRQAIQAHVLLPARDTKDFRGKAFNLAQVSPGLAIGHDDALVLLDRLDPGDRQDERWREVLSFVPSAGEEGKEIREAARRFAAHRPDLLAWIDSLAEPSEPKWKRKQDEEARRRRAERTVAQAEHRRDYLDNLPDVCAGEFRFVCNLARTYLKQYRDVGEDVAAHERIAAWVGADVAEAAHQGFEAFLQVAPPRPSAVRMAVSGANGRRWSAGDIIVAALAERLRTRDAPFEGVPSERLMAGLFEVWRSHIDRHAGIEGLLAALEAELRLRGDFECAVRLYIEPQLKKRATHVDHLYELMRSDDNSRDLRLGLAEDWLLRFPFMPAEPEAEMIDAVLRAGRGGVLAPLVAARLVQPLDETRRRNWDAAQLIVDFDAARARLERQGVEPELLWHLRARGGARRRDDRPSADLSSVLIVWIVTTFRSLFASREYPSGVRSGDTNPWDATEYLRGLVARLGNDVSDDAVGAMTQLLDAPSDGYTEVFKIYASEQRQARAEHLYVPPTLAEVRAVVEAGPPTSSPDLQAVLLEALDEVQARLKGDDVDSYRGFLSDDGKTHRKEEDCSNELIKLLRQVEPTPSYAPEVHVADDKRVDIVAQIAPKVIVPIEVKGQWHPKLWIAADEQLDHLYVTDWRAERGIYLVLWVGPPTKLQCPPLGTVAPTTPDALKAGLEATSKAAGQGRVAIVVLDLTRPAPP